MPDIENDGIPISETVRHDLEGVYFYCRSCHRQVRKTPQELIDLAGPDTGLWTLARRLRCTGCQQKDFTVRLGYPKDCIGIGIGKSRPER